MNTGRARTRSVEHLCGNLKAPRPATHTPLTIRLKRVYEAPSTGDGARVLVERLWPRGVRKAQAAIVLWARTAAPSAELRRWFKHDPTKWPAFKRRYVDELRADPAVLDPVLRYARRGPVTLVFSSRERRFNNAVALKEHIEALARATLTRRASRQRGRRDDIAAGSSTRRTATLGLV